MDHQHEKNLRLVNMIKMVLSTDEIGITCDDCFTEVDQYVEMLRAGQDAAAVLPHVKAHLAACSCCHEEFQALIKILESQAHDQDNAAL